MLKKLLIVILLSCIYFNVYSDNKMDRIAIFDKAKVIDTVLSGKSSSVLQQIKQEKQTLQDNLNKIKENILKLTDEKSKEKDDVKKLAYDKKIEELNKQYADYYKVTSYQIDQKLKNYQEPIFKEIFAVVKKIADLEGYTIVIDSKTDGLFYYSSDNDITQKIIDKFKDDTN
jgi:Skp family chaperone for outer membrane proteins